MGDETRDSSLTITTGGAGRFVRDARRRLRMRTEPVQKHRRGAAAARAILGAMLSLVSGSTLLGARDFRDDFSGDLSRWHVAESSARWVQAAQGVLRLDGDGRSVGLSAPDTAWRSFVLSFRMRMVAAPRADGHTGVRLREDPQNRPGEIMIFFRPDNPAFTGSGRTESAIGPAPGYRATEWHSYRLTATAGSVEVEIDGRPLGVVRGVQNEVGGVSFYAYNCVAEYDDVTLSPLAPSESAARPPWPVDLPSRPGGSPPQPTSLPNAVPVVLYATSPRPGPWPVVMRARFTGVASPKSRSPEARKYSVQLRFNGWQWTRRTRS